MLKWRFVQHLIDDAPEWPGVYVLWDGREPIAVGGALGGKDTIRSRLARHLAHFREFGVPFPTHYSWEICADAARREVELRCELDPARRDKPGPAMRQKSGATEGGRPPMSEQ